MTTRNRHLVWFTDDLRLDDNPTLLTASRDAETLICIYCLDHRVLRAGQFVDSRIGNPRRQFLCESLNALDRSLRHYGQHLMVFVGDPVQVVSDLISQFQVDAVFQTSATGWDERQQWNALCRRFPYLNLQSVASTQLFSEQQLPFSLDELPTTFSQFRRRLEQELVYAPLPAPIELPPPATVKPRDALNFTLPTLNELFEVPKPLVGGEGGAYAHLTRYFDAAYASNYKETRNALMGFYQSTKMSPWLARGCLSPRRAVRHLREYEKRHGSNDSTYWIFFELLWREYFHWYARLHGPRLYRFSGIRGKRPLTSFYTQRFQQWCAGETPWLLVNACMHQLNKTGYLSNRGRQIAASALVNELQVDWRAGSYYFEKQLIDYDAANNWGNWQYIAGVGADPRGGRHFNIEKQTQLYDPDGAFIERWHGGKGVGSIDVVDAADWPIRPD